MAETPSLLLAGHAGYAKCWPVPTLVYRSRRTNEPWPRQASRTPSITHRCRVSVCVCVCDPSGKKETVPIHLNSGWHSILLPHG